MRALEYLARRYSLDEQDILGLISVVGANNKFIAKAGLGNTLATYTGWSHVTAFGGYSIWKFAAANFTDNVYNMLWVENLDDDVHSLLPQVLEYAGAGGSEASGYFDHLFVYDGATFSSEYGGVAGDLSVDGGAYQTVLSDTGDFLYVGDAATFGKITVSLRQYAVGMTAKIEYWNGSAWTTLSATTNALVDGTSAMTSDGIISYTVPGD
jgi:hypothetical protein